MALSTNPFPAPFFSITLTSVTHSINQQNKMTTRTMTTTTTTTTTITTTTTSPPGSESPSCKSHSILHRSVHSTKQFKFSTVLPVWEFFSKIPESFNAGIYQCSKVLSQNGNWKTEYHDRLLFKMFTTTHTLHRNQPMTSQKLPEDSMSVCVCVCVCGVRLYLLTQCYWPRHLFSRYLNLVT
jgi:hypothetical protein